MENKKQKTQRISSTILFWLNLLGVGPFLVGLIISITASDTSQNVGAPLMMYAFAPIALSVLAIDVYKFTKRIIHWIKVGSW